MSEPRHVYDDNLAAEIERLRSRNIETVYQENRALEEEIERLRSESRINEAKYEEYRRLSNEMTDNMKKRIEDLEEHNKSLRLLDDGSVILLVEEIRAVWELTNDVNVPYTVREWFIKFLGWWGIVRCEGCGGDGAATSSHAAKAEQTRHGTCPACHGEGWVIEEGK